MNHKINKSTPPTANASMSAAKAAAYKQASILISFSFKYLVCEPEKFSYHPHEAAYFIEMLARVKSLSSCTKQELLSNRSGAIKCHPIDWQDTSEKHGFGFPKEDEIVDTPYQFSISKNEHGRVHGFFIENIFHVVWLDKNHKLYP